MFENTIIDIMRILRVRGGSSDNLVHELKRAEYSPRARR